MKTNKSKSREVWKSMKARCSKTSSFLKKYPTYKDCKICDEWKDFEVFNKWFNENYIEGNEMDKDLLKNENKLYCPEYCCFVPSKLNLIIGRKNNKKRGLPMGVYLERSSSSYVPQMNINGKSNSLGSFKDMNLAAMAYKMAKELEVKRVAKDFFIKRRIDERVYFSLLSWEHDVGSFEKMSIADYFLRSQSEKSKRTRTILKPNKSKYDLEYKIKMLSEFSLSNLTIREFELVNGLSLSSLASFKRYVKRWGEI